MHVPLFRGIYFLFRKCCLGQRYEHHVSSAGWDERTERWIVSTAVSYRTISRKSLNTSKGLLFWREGNNFKEPVSVAFDHDIFQGRLPLA